MKTTTITGFHQKKFSQFLQINLALLLFLFLTAFQSHATFQNTGSTLTRYTGTSSSVSIPSLINDTTITTIGTYQGDWHDLTAGEWVYSNTDAVGAFYCIDPDSDAYNLSAIFVDDVKQSNVYLTSLTLPNTVTTIEARTFTNSGLQTINFANGLISIGGSAFQNCNLSSLSFPETLTSISFGAFAENPNLGSVYIPASVTEIGIYAFGVFDEDSYTWKHPVNLTIKGYEGSQAQSYALQHGVTFEKLTASEDNNNNGTYSIGTSVTGQGSLSANTSSSAAGEYISFSATPSSNYTLSSVKVLTPNGQEISATYNYVMSRYYFVQPWSDVTIHATFTYTGSSSGGSTDDGNPNPNPDATYNIYLNAGSGGTLSPSKNTATPGDNVTVTATANSGYTLSGVTATTSNGTAINLTNLGNGSYSFYQPWSHVTFTATFTYTGGGTAPTQYYTISKNTPVGGSVTLSKTAAQQGDYVTVQTVANTGYALTSLTVKNSSGGTVPLTNNGSGVFAFTQPASNVTVTASFAVSSTTPDPEPEPEVDTTYYSVNASSVGGGTYDISHSAAQGGTRVSISFEAITGALFHSVSVFDASGNEIYGGMDVTNNKYVFIQPYSNSTVRVNFIGIPTEQHTITQNTTTGGSYQLDNETPYSNDLVNIHLFPYTNYTVMSVVVRDQEGQKVDTMKRENGKYYFIQPATPVTITVTFVYTPDVVQKYSDLSASDWYTPYIAKLYNHGYNLASSTNTFNPYEQVTRGSIALILAELSGEYIPTVTTAPFSDVAVGQWYTNGIAWCKSKGIITGYADNTFGVNETVTREQLATILYQFAKYKGFDTTIYNPGILAVYYDLPQISSYARTAMTWAVDYHLFTGYTQSITPQSNTTRAELAAIMCAVFMNGYR